MRSMPIKAGIFLASVALLFALTVYLPGLIILYHTLVDMTSPTIARLYLSLVIVLALLLLGWGGLAAYRLAASSRRRKAERDLAQSPTSELTDDEKESLIKKNLEDAVKIHDRETDGGVTATQLPGQACEIEASLTSGELRIAAFGTISSGKSALLNTLSGANAFPSDVIGGTTIRAATVPLPNEVKVTLLDTPGLGEDREINHERIAREQAMEADLILFVLDNDLRSFEDDVLKILAGAGKPLIVCLNKADWYGADKLPVILAKTAERVGRHGIPAEDVVAVRTRAASRTRLRILSDGSEVEETVMIGADVEPLLKRLDVALDDRKRLHLNNLVDRSRRLLAEAKELASARLEAEAWEVVGRATWQAAAATAVSPVPILDLVIGMGFIIKMVKDLAGVFQIQMDMDSARRLLGEMGANSVGIVGANLATPTAASIAASWFKAVPGIGTLVGGALQGFVQALMVRWIGSTFITYFRKEMKLDGGLADLARQKWLEATTPRALTQLLQEAQSHAIPLKREVS